MRDRLPAKILLIDDDAAILEIVGKALKKSFHVSTARDGREAFDILSCFVVDCILLDLHMPGMDGIEFLKILRRAGDATPVIVTTGKRSREYAEQVADLNIQGYVVKPYETAELAERIVCAIAPSVKYRGERKPPRKDLHPGLKYAVNFLDKNYDKSINVKEVTKAAGIAYSHFAEIFKKEFGMTFTCYLNKLRVGKAKKLIRESELPLSEIMIKAGFNTEQHFYSQFKRFTGGTPKSFKTRSIQCYCEKEND